VPSGTEMGPDNGFGALRIDVGDRSGAAPKGGDDSGPSSGARHFGKFGKFGGGIFSGGVVGDAGEVSRTRAGSMGGIGRMGVMGLGSMDEDEDDGVLE
jgi:hypothetical protein